MRTSFPNPARSHPARRFNPLAGILFPLEISDSSAGGSPPSPPSAPTGVIPIPTDGVEGQIDLTWDNVPGVTWEVYVSTTSGVYGAATATGLTTPEYSAISLLPGVLYYFVVKAVNGAGTSDASAETSETANQAPTIPDTPTFVSTGDPELPVEGDILTLDPVSASGVPTPSLTYLWQRRFSNQEETVLDLAETTDELIIPADGYVPGVPPEEATVIMDFTGYVTGLILLYLDGHTFRIPAQERTVGFAPAALPGTEDGFTLADLGWTYTPDLPSAELAELTAFKEVGNASAAILARSLPVYSSWTDGDDDTQKATLVVDFSTYDTGRWRVTLDGTTYEFLASNAGENLAPQDSMFGDPINDVLTAVSSNYSYAKLTDTTGHFVFVNTTSGHDYSGISANAAGTGSVYATLDTQGADGADAQAAAYRCRVRAANGVGTDAEDYTTWTGYQQPPP